MPINQVDQPTTLEAKTVAIGESLPTPADALKASYQTDLQKTANDNKAFLDLTAGRTPVSRETAKRYVDLQIGASGAKLDPATGMKDRANAPAHETDRLNSANQSLENIYNHLESGTITDSMRQDVLSVLFGDREFRQIIQSLHPTIDADYAGIMAGSKAVTPELQKTIDWILQHPEYNAKLKALVAEKIDLGKNIEDKGASLRQDLVKIDGDLQRITDDLDGAKDGSRQQRLDAAKRVLDRYKVGVDAGQPVAQGDVAVAINNIDAEIGAQEGNTVRLQAEMKGIDERRATTSIWGETPDAVRYKQIEQEMVKASGEKARLEGIKKQLEDIKKSAVEEVTQLAKEVDDLKQKQRSLQAERARAETQLVPLDTEKRLGEEQLAESLKKTFIQAAQKFLSERSIRAEQGYAAVMEARIKQETDEFNKTLDGELVERWNKAKKTGLLGRGKEVTEKDTALIEDDYQTMLKGGARGLVVRTEAYKQLYASVHTQYDAKIMAASTPEEKTRLTDEMNKTINKRLDAMVKARGGDVMLRVMTLRLKYGGMPKDSEIKQMQDMGLGSSIVEAAVRQVGADNKQLKDMIGKGLVDNPHLMDRLPIKQFTVLLSLIGLLLVLGFILPNILKGAPAAG